MKHTLFLLFLLANPSFALERSNEDNLTESLAKARKNQVSGVSYDLRFTLTKGSDEFQGKTTIHTTLTRTDQPLSVDFLWKEIRRLTVNGETIQNYKTRVGSFDIPAKNLRTENTIEVDYVGSFNKEGQGFQRSIDPEDQSEYLFTDFEPNYAHGLFPCFDQPDLKATYKVSVESPREWNVIGNTIPSSSTDIQGERKITVFPEMKPISTYLFFLGAGPYTEWKDHEGEIPIYIYTRKSLAKYVDQRKIFDTSKKGLRFYQEYFGYPYPFPKFGLIFVPEFAWGGMENPGAIAINEKNLFRGPVPKSKMDGRDSLILHEMAHMWFGDLVTMKWWNDLWLNESFATYLATIAQDRALKWDGSWVDFFSGKTWGYWQDQLATTHPIEANVPDVRSAKGNFDGITYAKGGAALKQLHFFVGEEGFREGLRSYFKKYAFSNTTRQDFLSQIASSSKKDLSVWTKNWLGTAGPNRVHADWSCKEGKIKDFTIVQEPSISGTLSPHRTKVALFEIQDSGAFHILRTEEIAYSGAKTKVQTLIGDQCPDFVYPNQDDQDYALFSLDPTSLKKADLALLQGNSSPLLRLMVWNTIGQMMRDAKLSPQEYFQTAFKALAHESDEATLGFLMGRHSPIRDQYRLFLGPKEREILSPAFEALLKKRVLESPEKSSIQMAFFDFWVTMAQTHESLESFKGYLSGSENLPKGIELDQDRRWAIVTTLAENGAENARALIASEEARDPSTSGKRSAYAARAAIPERAEKDRFWAELAEPEKIPSSNLKLASRFFHGPNFPELSKSYLSSFFKRVDAIDWKSKDSLIEIYFEGLLPVSLCSDELLKDSESHLKSAKTLTPLAKRAWIEANDELARCVKVRSFSAKRI